MGHTIIITEEMANQIKDAKEMTEYKFISNIMAFFERLKADPVHADVPEALALNGYDRRRMIAILRKNNIIERHEKISDKDESGRPKKATMLVSYKVPIKNLERKLKKLYIKLFEVNVPPKEINEDGEGAPMGGATNCASSAGAYVGDLGGLQKRHIFKVTNEQFAALKEQNLLTDSQIDEASTCASVMQGGGLNPEAGQYTMPFVGDKETLRRGDGVGGSTSVNIMPKKSAK